MATFVPVTTPWRESMKGAGLLSPERAEFLDALDSIFPLVEAGVRDVMDWIVKARDAGLITAYEFDRTWSECRKVRYR